MNSFAARLRSWLNSIPIQDPVQRKMASLLQIILLGLLGLIMVVTLLLLMMAGSSAQERSRLLAGNLFGFLVVFLPYVLLRRGYFHGSVLSIISVLMITPALAILVVFDLVNHGGVLFQFTLAIFLASLLADRRIPVLVFGLSAALVLYAAYQAPGEEPGLAGPARDTAINFIVFNGLITLLLDRFGGTLRLALTEARARERELEGEIAQRKQAEGRFQNVFESAPDAILLVDRQGRIVLVNSQAEKFFGYDRAELSGSNVDRLVPERLRGGHASFRAGFLTDPQTRPMGAGRDLFGVRRDGSEFPVEIGLTPVETQDGLLVMATVVDITGRKLAESAALENEARYHHILDAMMEGCQIIDFDWRYVYVNDVVAAQGKRTREELLHHTMMEMYPGIENTELFALLRRCMYERTPQRMENQFIFPDGGVGWFELSIQPAREGIFILSTDITGRKAVEEQNRFLANLVDSVSDAIIAVDLGQYIQSWNTGAEVLYGWKEEEVLGRQAREILQTEFLNTTRDEVMRQIMENGIWSGEVVQTHRNGGQIPAWASVALYSNAEGKTAGIVSVNRDITERKQAEKQLEKQNQRLKVLREIDTAILAAESMEVVFSRALSHILELVECRRASLTLIDWENSEAETFDVKAEGEPFIPKGTRAPLAVQDDLLPVLAGNQTVLINDLAAHPNPPPEFEAGIKEGIRSVCILPLFSRNNLIGMFNLSSEQTGFFDEEKISLGREVANQVAIAITQNRLFAELRELNAGLEHRVAERTLQLEAANRELEAFSYSVSHDLRAPLRAINGFSLALSTKHAESLGEQGIHYLNRVLENTRYMGDLIDDLLTLSRIARREMEAGDVNLSMLAHEIAGELRRLEPERQVTMEIEDQVMGRGDAGLIRVVLQNLIGNAWKFTSTREQAHIKFGVASSLDGGETVYLVQDNGVGFDMAYADKLFGAFQRLHSMAEFPGTGIGLATVQRVIHRHGGRIWAQAELDQGATFYFTIGGSHGKQ